MRTLSHLAKEAKALSGYLKKQMPKEVSREWLWESQNAFLSEADPSTGKKWADRQGIVALSKRDSRYFGVRSFTKTNVEPFLRYKKLHRTGRLLRGLKTKSGQYGNKIAIILYNTVEYAQIHDTGQGPVGRYRAVVNPPLAKSGTKVLLGVSPKRRPFMRPSKKILNLPATLVKKRMKKLGW